MKLCHLPVLLFAVCGLSVTATQAAAQEIVTDVEASADAPANQTTNTSAAGDVPILKLSWAAPTTRVNGAPLPSSDIALYRLQCEQQDGIGFTDREVDSVIDKEKYQIDIDKEVLFPAYGTYACAVIVEDTDGLQSIPSEPVVANWDKPLLPPAKPPTDLRIVAQPSEGDAVMFTWRRPEQRTDGSPLAPDALESYAVACTNNATADERTVTIPADGDASQQIQRTDLFADYGSYQCQISVKTVDGSGPTLSEPVTVDWRDSPPKPATNVLVVMDGAEDQSQSTFPQTQATLTQTFKRAGQSNLVNLPETVEQGDLLLIPFGSNSDTPNVGHKAPDGWVKKATTDSGDYIKASLFARVADGSEGGTAVDIKATAADSAVAQVYQVREWQGSLDGVAVSTATSETKSQATLKAPELSAPWGKANTLWIAVALAADDSQPVVGYPDGYTNSAAGESDSGNNASCSIGSAVKTASVANESPGVFRIADTESIAAFTIAVAPANAGRAQPDMRVSNADRKRSK